MTEQIDYEAKVRAAWFNVRELVRDIITIAPYDGDDYVDWDEDCSTFYSWQAAYAFTQQHREEIRQLEEEIALLQTFVNITKSYTRQRIAGRTLDRLTRELEQLKKGWIA